MQDERSFDVLVKDAENTQGEGKKVIPGNFLDLGSLGLAFGSLGPPYCLGGEGTSSLGQASLLQDEATARLGELQVHQVPFFAINGREGG